VSCAFLDSGHSTYEQNINPKLQSKTTIYTTMGQLAQKHSAINLSQGFPNFEPDPTLIDL